MRGISFLIAAILLGASSAAATADDKPICPDRPSKSTGACTVPQGKWQIETGLIDWSRDKSSGVRSDMVQWGSSLIKYGLTSRADVEVGIVPLETLRTRGEGVDEHNSSFGDMLLRMKYRLSPDDAPVQIALDPFVKVPTANHELGNGKVEGGVVVPIVVALGKTALTLSLDPELDLVADADGHGRHLATQQVVNLGIQVNDKLSVSTEIWAQRDWDPAGTGRKASADGSIAWLAEKDLQLDAGANFGLNSNTPDVELYTGVSVRF